ncbi:KN motif and ankyrin repeat domain-containing protein 4-like isoform X2 [Triplophysa rosa]|uniref:KN motif and ankyrin repeat domain-containing protein 4-like n=1 Tax=Triplophysa rosa TaxID=992332 RepID=A0A9W7WVZ9_TRIRA|nr:KN motif and ankyrin repeat domain-containing protein 4-like isoform X2 [Triplophysa rosa]KAI7809274.1 putative KN motif and ankyrin repeat domain-containing protein 4-like [Triplophysa rosa]
MDSRKANGISPKDNERKKRPPSYSVETPYGFHLDLDFLKYVDDIEKGNTIRRVPVQRRQRGQNNGIISRNLSLPGYGCRAPQWNSFSTLWPKTQLGDSHQHFDFHSGDITSAGYARRGVPYKSLTTSDMDASIKAFDEQPLGCYVRPNLLRASSLPLTVLLRQHSESTEDPTSSKEYLSEQNGSSDDVFNLSYSRMCGMNGTLQRLTAALERVGELETEIRVIPELKTQICILQEERERLLVQLHSQNDTTGPLDVPTFPSQTNNWDAAVIAKGNTQQAGDDWMNREYERLEKNVKASSEQVDAVATPTITHKMLPRKGRDMLDKEDQAKSLDTLKKKIVHLEQELHRLEVELERTRALLKQQVEESHFKDEKIKQLTIHLNTKSTVTSGTLPEATIASTQNVKPVIESCDALTGGQEMHTQEAILTQGQPSVSHADMEHHVKQLQELLQEQWECLCKDDLSGKTSSEHLPPRVCNIQDQLVTLVMLLSLYVFSSGEREPESKMEELVPGVEYKNLKKESLKTVSSRQSESEKDFYLKKNTNLEAGKGLTSQTTYPTVKTVIDGDQAMREDSNLKSQTQREENREAVNKDFIDACCFLKDHMDKVSEPDDEMSKTLTVVFQQWFSMSAEEDARADILSLYLSEVNSQTPTVLPFLVNMADDNGNTALHYSVSHCNFSIVKILLDTGMCKIDLRNKSGYTAIMLASMTSAESPGDLKVIQQLMELGDVNSRVGQVGQTALHLAVRHGRVPIVHLLLAQGADPNARDHAGNTPLISACERGHVNVVRILLEEANCDVNLKDKGGRNALSLATQASHKEIVDLLKARVETKSSDKCKVS